MQHKEERTQRDCDERWTGLLTRVVTGFGTDTVLLLYITAVPAYCLLRFIMSWLTVIAAVIFPNLGGVLGAVFTSKNMGWYNKQLKKPSWRPPNWAFGPAWTYLYSSMGYASYRVWVDLSKPDLLTLADLPPPLKLFLLQILLNWLWTPIFFGLKHISMAVIEILLLDAAVIMTLFAFWEVDSLAGVLFIPYLAWLTLATLLTISIWKENPQWRFGPSVSKEN